MELLTLSRYFFYFILFFIMSNLPEVLPMKWWKDFLNTTLGIKGRYWLLHAPFVLMTLWFCSPNEWWGWLVAACMVIALYDGGKTGMKIWEKPMTTFLLHLHHLGPILCFIHQNEKLRYSSAIMYFCIWFCHLFGFLEEKILGALGLKENNFVKKMYKWVYAIINVYTGYWYTQQFQFTLYDPQSLALLSQVFGRFFINSNWKNIPWMKCIELPGFTLVFLLSAFGMFYGVLAFLCAALIFGICNAFYDRKYPSKTFPEDPLILTDPIIQFLQSYEIKPHMKTGESEIQERAGWMQNMKFLKDYPLLECICKSDLESVKKIVLLSNDRSKYCYTVKEWWDSAPIGWAASTSEIEMVILLLLHGANPWGKNAASKCQIAHGYQNGKPFMKKFWDEFIELCPKEKKRNPGKVAREKMAKEQMDMEKKEC